MKLNIKITLFFVFLGSLAFGGNFSKDIDKSVFYSAVKSAKLAQVNEELEIISSAEFSEKEAYEGVLLMKKAALVKIPSEKLKFFKKGRIKLETALLNDNSNGEYHFLRLVIEENAPKIVKYHSDLETDKTFVKQSFKKLSPVVQQAIIDYSKNSKILTPKDL